MFSRIYSHTIRKNRINMVRAAMMSFKQTPVLSAKKSVAEAAENLEEKISGITHTVSKRAINFD
jgi:proton translocating ATP synthase F1 alpha subunit